ncbi:MAG: class I SAM-dependent methyltransferase [Patescibacteria group bacterium]|nr:class I SAM-dependent methyltransferase [Patescibacteria group bacterium]
MALSLYHQQYAALSDEEIQKKLQLKDMELRQVFSQISVNFTNSPVTVAVFGCGDRRLIAGHEEIFEKILGRSVEITTFDVTTEHLQGEKNIVQHDCTEPLSEGTFNIVFAHSMLKFVEVEKQWRIIQNSFQVLTEGGVAIHILDDRDRAGSGQAGADYFSVPWGRWKVNLMTAQIPFLDIPFQPVEGVDYEIPASALVLLKQI